MDIRNFFGSKSTSQSIKPTPTPTPAPDRKADSKVEPAPTVPKASRKASSRACARAPPKKKTRVIVDDSDDSDATDCLESDLLSSRTEKPAARLSTKTEVQVNPDVDLVSPQKAKSPLKRTLVPSAVVSDSPKKKLRSAIGDVKSLGVNSETKGKTTQRDPHRSPKMKCIALDDDTTEEDELPSTKKSPSNRRKKSPSRPHIHDDYNEDSDDDLPETPKENNRPKRKASSTTPTKKTPTKQAPPAKKDPLLEPTIELASFDCLQAAPECLAGLTFVFSGILNNLGREESIDYVKGLGGRVTTAVSGKTSYLVVGDLLEDGRPFSEGSKYKKAIEIGVKVIHGEGKFYGLCKLYSDKVKPIETTESVVVAPAPAPIINPYAKKANPYAKAKPSATSAAPNPYASKTSAASAPPAQNKLASDPNALWADKYAPTSTADILGNQDSVKKLKNCKFSFQFHFMHWHV